MAGNVHRLGFTSLKGGGAKEKREAIISHCNSTMTKFQ